MKKQYKIPTLLGIILLVLGVAIGVFLVQNKAIFFIDARQQQTPQTPTPTKSNQQEPPTSKINLPKTSRFNLEPIETND